MEVTEPKNPDKCGLSFAEQLRLLCQRSPSALAIQFKDRKLSYGQLVERLEELQSVLGPPKGMRVIILLPDSLAAYLFYLYLFLGEALIIPLSIQVTSSRLQSVIERIEPHLVVTSDLLFQTHRDVISEVGCLVVGVGKGNAACDFHWPGSVKSLRDIPRNRVPDSESTRIMVFTSGSTGVPKGVCLSESNVVSAARMMVDFLPLAPTTKSLVTVPLYDYYGFIQIFGHILGGGGFIMGHNPAFARQFFRSLEEEGVTDLVLVPHTMRKLTEGPDLAVQGMRSLKRITSSSDVLTEDLLRRVFQCNSSLTVVNIYGLTEAGRACYRKIRCHTPFSKSIGRPSKGVEVLIEGTDSDPGEIIIRGPNVMLGYFRQINHCRVEYNPCSEMRTGDLGYFDASGEIVLLGRRDHVINIMGSKIHPSEIEMAAMKIEGVREAQARVASGPDGQPTIHLDVVPANGNLSLEAVKDAMRKALPRMFLPSSIIVVPDIARTELGSKIIRRRS